MFWTDGKWRKLAGKWVNEIYAYRGWVKEDREIMEIETKLGNNFCRIGCNHYITERDFKQLMRAGYIKEFISDYPYEDGWDKSGHNQMALYGLGYLFPD